MEHLIFFVAGVQIEIVGGLPRPNWRRMIGIRPGEADAAQVLRARLESATSSGGSATVRLARDARSPRGAGLEPLLDEVTRCLSGPARPRRIRFCMEDQQDFRRFCRIARRAFAGMTAKTFRNPVPTVDIIIRVPGGIVLIQRRNPPAGWAIPGGFVDYGESLEDAARREAREETGLRLEDLRQFRTYSDPGRDPRMHTISTVFAARGRGRPVAADDARSLAVFPRGRLPEPLAFDHRRILEEYFARA